mmetsp:Transcript_12633/g.50499  ORF Transcript_12633/g.50499 Transcript_12633/m.50499 type:complete len:699 (+) Transcript_12633:130-2226(+)
MPGTGGSDDDPKQRGLGGWKASKPGAFGSKENLLSRGRSSTPDLAAGRGARRAGFLAARPGTMIAPGPGASVPEVERSGDKSLPSIEALILSPLEREEREEREESSPSSSHSSEARARDTEQRIADDIERMENTRYGGDKESAESPSETVAETATATVERGDSERDTVEEKTEARDESERNEEREESDTNRDREIEGDNGEVVGGGNAEEESSNEEKTEDSDTLTEIETEPEIEADIKTETEREPESEAETETENTETERGPETDTGPDAGTEREIERNPETEADTEADTETETEAGDESVLLRGAVAQRLKERRPVSDALLLQSRTLEQESARARVVARRGTEVSAVAPSTRSFDSTTAKKIIINSTGQKREHSLKADPAQRDGRGGTAALDTLGSILRRSTVSRADAYAYSAPVLSPLTSGDAVDVPYAGRKGRSGTISVSPADYQSQQQFWFTAATDDDSVSSSPDSPVPVSQPPQSRLRNETFVMPIICSIGAITTSSLLKNPMISELRTHFADVHGLTSMHTLHVHEAFFFMKQMMEVTRWLEKVFPARKAWLPDLAEALEDGTALCELANAVQAGVVADVFPASNDAELPPAAVFGRIENVAKFLAACERDFGLSRDDLFAEADVIEHKSIVKVVHGLHVLARKAAKINERLPELVEVEEGSKDAYNQELVEVSTRYFAKAVRHHMAPLLRS